MGARIQIAGERFGSTAAIAALTAAAFAVLMGSSGAPGFAGPANADPDPDAVTTTVSTSSTSAPLTTSTTTPVEETTSTTAPEGGH